MLRSPLQDEKGVHESLSQFKDPIQVSYRNVRDSIIAKVKELAPRAPWASVFIEHLKKMGSGKLDKYNKIHFSLQEFSLGLDFFTGLVDGEELDYTISADSGDPPPELKRSKFLGLF
jgi:hypothetical protein